MLDDRIRVGQVSRIDAFHVAELGCNASLLSAPGVHVVPSERRGRPGWGGYTVPILALSTPTGGVVSVRSDLLERVRSGLGPLPEARPLGPAEFTRLHHVARIAIREAGSDGSEAKGWRESPILDFRTSTASAVWMGRTTISRGA